MRILDQKKVPYKSYTYDTAQAISGMEVATVLNQNPNQVFKTLVTVAASKKNYVFVVPVNAELHLKKAAKAVGEKSVAMLPAKDLLPLTGYVHGGCSPVGMKKQFPTVFHETCILYDTVCVSAGRVGYQVEVNPEDLMALVGAVTADVTVEG